MHSEQLHLVQEWNGESRLSFELGDAMAEFGTAGCCDVVLNIESSHHSSNICELGTLLSELLESAESKWVRCVRRHAAQL